MYSTTPAFPPRATLPSLLGAVAAKRDNAGVEAAVSDLEDVIDAAIELMTDEQLARFIAHRHTQFLLAEGAPLFPAAIVSHKTSGS